jgi:hypothetical protein
LPVDAQKRKRWQPDQIERRAKTIYDEWLALRDAREARLALAEVPLSCRAALVASLLQRSLDSSGPQRDHLLRLFTETVDTKLEPLDAPDQDGTDVSSEDSNDHDATATSTTKGSVATGDATTESSLRPLRARHLRRATNLVLAELEDLVIDHPRAVSFLGHWLAHCFVHTAGASDVAEQTAVTPNLSLWGRPVTVEEVAAALRQVLITPAMSWCANGSDLALPLLVDTLDALRIRSPLFAMDQLEALMLELALPVTDWVVGAGDDNGPGAGAKRSAQVQAAFARVGLEQLWLAVADRIEPSTTTTSSATR